MDKAVAAGQPTDEYQVGGLVTRHPVTRRSAAGGQLWVFSRIPDP
jgi:hypothetical protein